MVQCSRRETKIGEWRKPVGKWCQQAVLFVIFVIFQAESHEEAIIKMPYKKFPVRHFVLCIFIYLRY